MPPAKVQVPCVVNEVLYVTCVGIWSVTVTPWAVAGPPLVTVSV